MSALIYNSMAVLEYMSDEFTLCFRVNLLVLLSTFFQKSVVVVFPKRCQDYHQSGMQFGR